MKFFFLCFLLSFSLDLAFFSTTSDNQLLYLGFTGTNLTLDGTTTVTSNGLLELTDGSIYSKGHAFYPIPLHLRKSSNGIIQSFSVAFVFAIRSRYPIISQHGMAFIIAPRTNFSDALGSQYLGFMNSLDNGNLSNHIFAIELDTIQNRDIWTPHTMGLFTCIAFKQTQTKSAHTATLYLHAGTI